jgi:hypothetical protein
MRFDYRQQDLVIQYDFNPAIIERLAATTEIDPHLNVNRLLSNPSVTVLQSPTSSSLAEVSAGQAILRTQYFGEYIAPENRDAREQYTLAKAKRLLALLSSAEARFTVCGVVTVLRCSIREPSAQHIIKKKVQDLLPGIAALSCGGDAFDFQFRATRRKDGGRFCGIQLSWYQERGMFLPVTVGAPLMISDWQMPLADEGLEVRYDQNNKAGLFDGRLVWSSSDFLALIQSCLRDMLADLAPFMPLVESP